MGTGGGECVNVSIVTVLSLILGFVLGVCARACVCVCV